MGEWKISRGVCQELLHGISSRWTTRRKKYEERSPLSGSFYTWINNITDRTLDVVFSRFRGFSLTLNLRQRSKGVTRMLSLCLVIQRCLRGTHLGFCLRIFVNEKPLNLEKTISSVQSVLLIIYPSILHLYGAKTFSHFFFLNLCFFQRHFV